VNLSGPGKGFFFISQLLKGQSENFQNVLAIHSLGLTDALAAPAFYL
jgi:hypothetical protein